VTKTATLTVLPPVLSSLSCAPTTVTGGAFASCAASLSGPAYSGGIKVSVESSNTEVASLLIHGSLPQGPILWIPEGKEDASFAVRTKPVMNPTPVSISASYGGVTKTTMLMVIPPVLSSLSCAPTTVTGGTSVNCTASLSGPAYSGGIDISLSSSEPAVATGPASVSVQEGQTSASFVVTTQPVPSQASVTIWASFGNVTKTATLTVVPPVLSAFTCTPTTVIGGSSASCTVALSGPAYSGGVNVALSSSATVVAVQASVTVPAGETTVGFGATTQALTGQTSVTVSASYGGVTKTVTLTINPASLSRLLLNGALVLSLGKPPDSGFNVIGFVELNGLAPPDGAAVTITFSGPVEENVAAHVAVPGYPVEIQSGTTNTTFPVIVYKCPSYATGHCDGKVTATYRGVSLEVYLNVQ
jgi:hypothetical protein